MRLWNGSESGQNKGEKEDKPRVLLSIGFLTHSSWLFFLAWVSLFTHMSLSFHSFHMFHSLTNPLIPRKERDEWLGRE